MLADINLFAWLGSLLGIAYVILMARHNRLAWIASAIGTSIHTVILWVDQLPMQALLHLVYLLLAIVGWYRWRPQQAQPNHIKFLRPIQHLWLIASIALLSISIGAILAHYQLSQKPWLDAATTVSAILVSWLVIQKYIDNWLYWIVIDIASAYLFWQANLLPLALLYLFYTALAIYGYRYWLQLYRQQNKQTVPTTS